MTIGTSRNKQHDRTIPATVFIGTNVSKWLFFRFDTPFKGKYWSLNPWKNIENADFWWLFRLQGAVKNFWDVVWHQTGYLKCSRSVGLSNDTICVSIRWPKQFLIEKILTPPPKLLGLELASLFVVIIFFWSFSRGYPLWIPLFLDFLPLPYQFTVLFV